MGGPGPEATAVAGPLGLVAIVREAADVAGSSGGAPLCEHLTFWGLERGFGLSGQGERACGGRGEPGLGLSRVGELQGRGGACTLEAEERPYTAFLCPGSGELVVSWWL